MGSDLYYEMKRVRDKEGDAYRVLVNQLAEVLGVSIRWDVTGPGDRRGPTDHEIVDLVKQLKESR